MSSLIGDKCMHLSWLVKVSARLDEIWSLLQANDFERERISGDGSYVFLWMNFKWDINDNKLRGYISDLSLFLASI